MIAFLNMRVTGIDFTRIVLFLISPFLSLPFLIHGILNRSRVSVYLFVMLIGIIEFLYIPTLTNDKAVYYYYYDVLFNEMTPKDFISYLLSTRVDFMFHTVLYLCSRFNIPAAYFFFILTISTVGIWYKLLFDRINWSIEWRSNMFTIFFMLILVSFSPTGLFSGIRFYFAISLVLLALSNYVSDDKKFLSSFFVLLLASLFHFSCMALIPLYIFFHYKKSNTNIVHIVFGASLIFLFVPRTLLLDRLGFIGITSGFEDKVSSYLGDHDYIENNISLGNFNNALRFFVKTLWVYVAYFYVFFSNRRYSILRNLFLLVMALSNLFYAAPTVYNRYILLGLGVYLILLISDYYNGIKNKNIIYITLTILSLNFFGNIYALRSYFINSLHDVHSWTLPTILLKDEIKFEELKDTK